jgi:hypothetical protein
MHAPLHASCHTCALMLGLTLVPVLCHYLSVLGLVCAQHLAQQQRGGGLVEQLMQLQLQEGGADLGGGGAGS